MRAHRSIVHPRRNRLRPVILSLMRTNAQIKAEVREVISETPEARYYHRLSCIELLAQGHSYARVAKPFGHSPSTLKTLVAQVPGGRGRSTARGAARPERISTAQAHL
jgi:hypothetical protein